MSPASTLSDGAVEFRLLDRWRERLTEYVRTTTGWVEIEDREVVD